MVTEEKLWREVHGVISWATDRAIQAEHDAQFEALHRIDKGATNKIMKLFLRQMEK